MVGHKWFTVCRGVPEKRGESGKRARVKPMDGGTHACERKYAQWFG